MSEERDDPPYIAEMRKQRDTLARELERLEAMLEIHDAEKRGPYSKMRVIDATLAILRDSGSMQREELVKKLIAGGCSAGTSQPEVNISRSLEQNKHLGKIIISKSGKVSLP